MATSALLVAPMVTPSAARSGAEAPAANARAVGRGYMIRRMVGIALAFRIVVSLAACGVCDSAAK